MGKALKGGRGRRLGAKKKEGSYPNRNVLGWEKGDQDKKRRGRLFEKKKKRGQEGVRGRWELGKK